MKKLGMILIAMWIACLLTGCAGQKQAAVTCGATTPSTTIRTTEQTTQPTTQSPSRYLVVIDPGHQAKANSQKEPLGPGSDTLKAKVSSGTAGCYTGIPEYELNLAVSFMLKDLLEARGYAVVMVRTIHDVNISNAERSQMANDLQADAFVRIHANSSDDSEANGILTICQTKENPYNGDLFEQSYLLSQLVLDEMVATTGAERRYVWKTDTMTGINWCRVPVTIVEMGFMSNEGEDILLSSDAYRWLVAEGIANGLDRYFAATSGG